MSSPPTSYRIMNEIKTKYKEIYQFLKHIKKYIIFSTLLFAMFIIIGYYLPDSQKAEFLRGIKSLYGNMLPKNSNSELSFASLSIFALLLFLNNYIKGSISMFTGQLLSLPALLMHTSTAASVGIVGSVANNKLIFLAGVVSHGVIEFFAFIITLAISAWVAITMFKKPSDEDKKYRNFKFLAKVNVYLILPLFAIAAIIEAFVSLPIVYWYFKNTVAHI